jgi:two-component system phosphate regulon sensor histidine kinase PhoR
VPQSVRPGAGLLSEEGASPTGFRRIVMSTVWLTIVPSVVLLVLGILMLVFYRVNLNILFGIFVLVLVGLLATGTVLTLVFVRREANLSKLQSDFVSKVSHELRTPLTSIRMFVETLQMKRVSSPAEVDACLDVLNRETARLTERIERLLDWGRMEAGKRVYESKLERVEDIVQDALGAFEGNHVGRHEPVAVELAPQLPSVWVDRGALVDALLNLLSNAYKYSRERGRICLKASADERHVRIAVIDQGIGIARREHRRIFDKFYRSNELLSSEVEGSGLGLAIVRHVVQAHGGRVELDSELGKGSTFTVVLPRPDGPEGHKSMRPPALTSDPAGPDASSPGDAAELS